MVPYLCPECETLIDADKVIDVYDMIQHGFGPNSVDHTSKYCPKCYCNVYDIWEIKNKYKLYDRLYWKLKRIERK